LPRVAAQQAAHSSLLHCWNLAWRQIVADKIIVYWRDIPAQVIVKKRRETAKRELSLRFTEAIDMCAMRVGARDSDAYLAEWRKGDPVPVSDELEAEAEKAAAEIESTFTRERLIALVGNEGFEKESVR
jgi:Virulence factor